MDSESKKLIKKQLKNPKDYTNFQKLIDNPKIYEIPQSLT